MKWTAISRKTGNELVRDRTALFFSLMFPLIFVLLFGVAFGSFTEGNITFNIGVINFDTGVNLGGENVSHGKEFAGVLENMYYQDDQGKNTETKVFEIRKGLTEKEAKKLVEDQDIAGYIIIPRNFSAAVLAESMRFAETAISLEYSEQFREGSSSINFSDTSETQALLQKLMANFTGGLSELSAVIPDYDKQANATVVLQGDPGRSTFFTVTGIIEAVLENYIYEVKANTILYINENSDFDIDPSILDPNIKLSNEALKSSEFSVFDYQVPGVIVFAILMGAMTVTIFLAKEESNGTLTRLKLTKMSSFDLLFGTTVPYTFLALVQVMILVGVALLMGYHYNPGASIFLALFIAVIGALASVALGLILAAFVKNEDQAGSIAPAIVVPLSFLTGAFFPMPTVTLSDNFLGTGSSFELFDWLPWTQCSKALSQVLTFGGGLSDVLFEISLMIFFTVVLFIIGVLLYHKKRLRSI